MRKKNCSIFVLLYIFLLGERVRKEYLDKLKKINIELNERKKGNLASYNTGEIVHKKQIEFHKCGKRNRWVFGGNRTGKTECGAVESVYIARGNHPYRENKKNVQGWVVSLTKQVQRDVAQAKILKYLEKSWIEEIVMQEGRSDNPESGIIDFILIKNVLGGVSKIAFKSCDQGREKFQGTSLDFVWFDEEPPFDIYRECQMRVFDKKGDIFGTMTPLKGLTWVYNEIYLNENNNKEVWYEQIEWKDNPYLSKDEISLLSQTLSKEELEARQFGKFVNSQGLVYSEFDENVNVIEPFDLPKEWQDNISIDPGLNNPLSAHWYAKDFDGNIYVVEEHFEAKRSIEYHAQKIKEKSKKLGWKKSSNGMYSALIDSAANQRTLASEKNVVELFYENGILTNPRVNKDLFSGISVVKRYLKSSDGKSRLFIFKNCVNLIREIKAYWWGGGDNPIKKDDHCLDELRYYLMSINDNFTPKRENKNDIQKEKDRLIRLIRRRNF